MKTAVQSTAEGKPEQARTRRIAIVDDDASIRAALRSLMRSVQMEAEAYGSAEEFLASGRAAETDCLILDLYLPGMNGFELQARLRAEQCTVPIIFMTAHADDITREQALKGGAVEFLSKPVRREPLFKAIQAALG